MNMFKNVNYLGLIALSGAAALVGSQLAGCDVGAQAEKKAAVATPEPVAAPVQEAAAPNETPATPAAPAPTEAPAPKPPRTELELQLGSADDFFGWYGLREQYLKAGKLDAKALEAFAARDKALREKNPPIAVSEYFEVLATDWETQAVTEGDAAADEKSAEGSAEKMLAKFILLKRKPLDIKPDQQAQLFMRLKVDESHEHYFDDKQKGGVDFGITIDTSDEAWPVGEARYVRRNARVPVLPYNIFLCFNVLTKDGQQFVDRLGGMGKGWADLGWWADLPNDPQPAPAGATADEKKS